jgi:carbon starvation protein
VKKIVSILLWLAVALVGAGAYATLATTRGERLNSVYILAAALCTYAIGYRFYSKWIAARVLALNDRRATPCEVHEDGKDFVKTNQWIVFGHHFAAISGPGPLVGPVLAAQFGYLPGTLWILIGVVLGGAVQDFTILFASMRRDGKSLGQMVKEELNSFAGAIGVAAILAIMVILIAVLALVVVNVLGESPWGVFTVAATIPIAMLMGGYLRFFRVGKVLEVSAIGVVLLLLAVWGGQYVHGDPALAKAFTFSKETIAWSIIGYGLLASVLPVWLLLAPRDYLSTFMKLGTIAALALGVFLVLPDLEMEAVTKFVDGSGLVVAGKLFPFCFITIACGAISGFHTLISSGVTPKIIARESHARQIGYGAMCLESLVAIMALIAACTLDPGVYLAMNVKGSPEQIAAVVEKSGLIQFHGESGRMPVTVSDSRMKELAREVGETSLYGRTGGAATLAVGMASIFGRVTHGRWLDLWYHFAVMFEALFILTTLDAGTRVGRYLLQDVLGNLWKPLADTRSIGANVFASMLVVGAWGWFLIQGVRDPLGGINSLWPLFGIANQLLAALALCLGTTILLKTSLARKGSPVLALVTFVPLTWLLTVTMAAGAQKIFHPDKRIGFLAAARDLDEKLPGLDAKAAAVNRTLHFNAQLDALVAAVFLALVALVVIVSVREWLLLLAQRKAPELRETEPVWLPAPALGPERPAGIFGTAALMLALLREVSGQSAIDRAVAQHETPAITLRGRENVMLSKQPAPVDAADVYVGMTEKRFDEPRCC